MGRMPARGYPFRQAVRRVARCSAKRETLNPKLRRVRKRSNGTDLPAMQIDAPVGKNLGTRRLAPHDSRQEMPKRIVRLEPGSPGYNGSGRLR